MKILIALLAIGALLPAATIVNGSFENGVSVGGGFATLNAGNPGITGWTIGGAGVDYIGAYWQAADGVRSVDLNALTSGSVSQTITDFVVGQNYVLTFALSGNPEGVPTVKTVALSVSGIGVSNYEHNITGFNTANMGWTDRVLSFTALSTSHTISFASLDQTPFGPAVDNVRLTTSSSAVPEPATYALLGAGLVAGWLLRRRQ